MSAVLAFLVAVTCQPATVGLAGSYGREYATTASALGARCLMLSRDELASPERLAPLDALIISHLHEGWPRGGQEAVTTWVEAGGLLLLEIGAVPPKSLIDYTAYTSGWGGSVRIEAVPSPLTVGLKPGQVLRYGAWSGGLSLPEGSPVKVLAYWDLSDAATYERPVNDGFATCTVAMAEADIGRGKVFYSGAGLFMMAPKAVETWLKALFDESQLPLMAVEKAWNVDVSQEAASPARRGTDAVVFADESCPAPGMPRIPTSFFIDTLSRRLGLRVTLADAAALATGEWLKPDNGLLILACGEAFPLEALDDLKRFLASGGAVLATAGVPFSHLLAPAQDGGFHDLGASEDERRGATYFLYSRLGFLTKVATLLDTDTPAGAVTVNWPDSNLPTSWPLTGGTTSVFLAGNGLSPRTVRPLVVSVSREGRVLSCPVSFSPVLARFPKARFLSIGFSGDSHPLNPAAWDHAEDALVAFTRLLLEAPVVLIGDVWPHEPLYRAGEDVCVGVRLVASRGPANLRCRLRILTRDTWREVFTDEKDVTVGPEGPADLEFIWAKADLRDWAYVAVAQIDNAEPPFDMDAEGFLALQPGFCSRARPAAVSPTGLPLRGDTPEWFSGINLYVADHRGVGMFFTGGNQFGSHPTVQAYDRDLSLMRLLGGNTARTHYFDLMITPEILADTGSHAVRRLDAYNMLHAAHDAAAIYGPFTFTPGRYNVWQNYMKAKYGEDTVKANAYTSEQWLDEMEEYYEALAAHCRALGAENIVWQLINEPEAYPPHGERDPARRREGVEVVDRWCRRMSKALERAGYLQAGVGHSTAPMSYGWDPRGSLNWLCSFDVHHYGAATVHQGSSNALWSIPFGLAYGRPAVLGEYGLPNATHSRAAFLGHWLAAYEQALLCILGESGLGFLNFYLNCGMGNVDAPEWGMVRPDYTEKPALLAWKRWNWVLRRIAPDEILPPNAALVFDPEVRLAGEQILQQLGQTFLALLGEGLHTSILGPGDLDRLARSGGRPQVAYAPADWLGQIGRTALAKAAEQGLEVFDDLEGFRQAARALCPVKLDRCTAEALYVRALHGDRVMIAVVENGQASLTFEMRSHRYEISLPEGRGALLVLGSDGAPEMIASCGPVSLNGRVLVDGPAEGYAVWAGHGRSLDRDGTRELWAESQTTVRGSLKLPDELGARSWKIETRSTVPEEITRQASKLLQTRGVRLDGRSRARIVLCGSDWPKAAEKEGGPLARRSITVRYAGSTARLVVGSEWIEEAWTGLVLVDRAGDDVTVYVYGLTDAGLDCAVRRLASLRVLEDCLTTPYAPLELVAPQR